MWYGCKITYCIGNTDTIRTGGIPVSKTGLVPLLLSVYSASFRVAQTSYATFAIIQFLIPLYYHDCCQCTDESLVDALGHGPLPHGGALID